MGDALRHIWAQARPTAFWGAVVAFQIVAAFAVVGYWIDPDDPDWLRMAAPVCLALGAQPVVASILGARLFTSAKDTAPWLLTWGFGVLLLQAIPLPAEALRTSIILMTVDELTRADREAWIWMVISAPVSAFFFGLATASAQLTRRTAIASISAYVLGALIWSVLVAWLFEEDAVLMLGWGASLVAVTLLSGGIFTVRTGSTFSSLLGTAIATAFTGAVSLGAWQYLVFVDEGGDLGRETRRLAAEVENARTTAARLPEFRAEVERKERLRDELRLILPETMDVPRFLETLAGLARESSLRIVGHDVSQETYEFYTKAVVVVELEGERRAVGELGAAVTSLSRLVRWQDAEVREDGITLWLSIFSMAPEDYVYEERCGESASESAVFWPPFVAELQKRRDERSQWCDELGRLLPIHQQVDQYQALLAEIEELERVIERLRSG